MSDVSDAPRFGVMTLQSAPYATLRERWRRVEAMGWDAIWVADHTTAQYPSLIAYEAWSLMGALARETERVRIGTLVTPITFRHPTILAMAVTTVDHASGGRVELGIGAGGARRDQGAVGLTEWTAHERVTRFAQQVEILDALLRGERVSRSDGPYPLQDVVIEPPLQRPRPPIVIAARGSRALRVAARYADTWNTMGGQPMRDESPEPVALRTAVAETRRQVEALDMACVDVGRDPRSLRRSVLVYRYDPWASVDAFYEYVARYQEVGIDEFIFYWPSDPRTFAAAPDRERTLERIAADALPRLRPHV